MKYLDCFAWEEPGYRISEHTGAPSVDWSTVSNITIHYPGGGSFPASPDVDWMIGYMRRMQRDYVTNRGYSIGYNEVVSQTGIVAEARGAGFRCAANGSRQSNQISYAIQVAVPNSSPASSDAVAAVRSRIDWAQKQAGRKLAVTGHRDHKATACPGAGMYAQVVGDVFDVPYPPEQENDMTPIEPTRVYDTRPEKGLPGGVQGAFNDGEVRHVAIAMANSAFIHVAAFAAAQPGHISVSADGSFSGGTSIVNYEGDGGANSDGAPVLCPGGHLYVKAHSACHIHIDVYAVGD